MQRKIKHFEDFETGQVFESENYKIEQSEIIEFAKKYDPQSFHTGEKDKENIAPLFDDLTCSGYHVAAIAMRLMVDTFLKNTACLTSPGLEYVKWLGPVGDNDSIKGRFEILEKRRSKSDPRRGIIKVKEELFNQKGSKVFESVKTLFIGIRDFEDNDESG